MVEAQRMVETMEIARLMAVSTLEAALLAGEARQATQRPRQAVFPLLHLELTTHQRQVPTPLLRQVLMEHTQHPLLAAPLWMLPRLATTVHPHPEIPRVVGTEPRQQLRQHQEDGTWPLLRPVVRIQDMIRVLYKCISIGYSVAAGCKNCRHLEYGLSGLPRITDHLLSSSLTIWLVALREFSKIGHKCNQSRRRYSFALYPIHESQHVS